MNGQRIKVKWRKQKGDNHGFAFCLSKCQAEIKLCLKFLTQITFASGEPRPLQWSDFVLCSSCREKDRTEEATGQKASPGARSLEESLPSPYGRAMEMCSVAKVTIEPSGQKLLWAAATSRAHGNQVVLPAQMDTTWSSANILYLWAWNSSQRLCPDWAAMVNLSPVTEQHAFSAYPGCFFLDVKQTTTQALTKPRTSLLCHGQGSLQSKQESHSSSIYILLHDLPSWKCIMKICLKS